MKPKISKTPAWTRPACLDFVYIDDDIPPFLIVFAFFVTRSFRCVFDQTNNNTHQGAENVQPVAQLHWSTLNVSKLIFTACTQVARGVVKATTVRSATRSAKILRNKLDAFVAGFAALGNERNQSLKSWHKMEEKWQPITVRINTARPIRKLRHGIEHFHGWAVDLARCDWFKLSFFTCSICLIQAVTTSSICSSVSVELAAAI